jgi:hypothetical protein
VPTVPEIGDVSTSVSVKPPPAVISGAVASLSVIDAALSVEVSPNGTSITYSPV